MERDFKLRDRRVRPQLCQIEGPAGTETVEVRSMEVLLDLVRHAGEVRARQELIDAVWGDAFVTEEALSHCIWDLRRALGDNARKPVFIQTVPRRGYRLIAPLSWLDAGPGQSDRYELLEELGSGSMGVVWKAEDTLLHRTVALKFLPREWSRDPEAKTRFLKEARIAARLDHPNICPLYELGETDDGRLFLVLPYYAGGTLKARLNDGPLPWREAVELAIAVAGGLDAAHRAKIVHRDIKPANLLFSVLEAEGGPVGLRGPIKIVDFGIARFGHETQSTWLGSSSAGTPAYKSPEQTRGETVDHRSDLWALGVLLYEMVAGERPFRGEYEQAIVHAILESEPTSLAELSPETPPELSAVVERLLRKDATERYDSAARVLSDLEALLVEPKPVAEVVASSASVTTDPRQGVRKTPNPWRWGFAALGLLVAAVLFTWFLPAEEPIRVIVTEPTIEDPTLNVLAAGLQVSILDTLLGFEGLTALDPSELRGLDLPPPARAAAKAVGADEALTIRLERRGEECRIVLKRIDGEGQILWSGDIDTLASPGPYDALAEAVRTELQQAYGERRWRHTTTEIAVRDEDYQRFLALQARNLDRAQRTTVDDLRALEEILETSPNFLPAHVALAAWAAVEFRDSRQLESFAPYLARIRQAVNRFPRDPRPLYGQFELERASGRLDEAEGTLQRLRKLRSGGVRLELLETRLLRDRGQLQEAFQIAKQAAEHRPSWRMLFSVADVAYQLGEVDEARNYLRRLLDLVPDSSVGLSKLAEVELVYGDLDASADLYHQLASRFERRSYWNNLGTAAYLNGDYPRAKESYERALLKAPDHPLVLSNLADVDMAAGRPEAAKERCTRVVERLSGDAALGAINQMLRARCLARLGNFEEAVATILEGLQEHAENADVRYHAAVVFTLAGDRTSAMVNARQARAQGIQPRWFRVPELAPLRQHPEFKGLL